MRSARALLASLGAGTCLILAGTLAMATLSTVVAFSGLPGIRAGSSDALPAAVLATAAVPTAGTAEGSRVVALAPPDSRAPVPARRPVAQAGARAGATSQGVTAAPAPRGPGATTDPVATDPVAVVEGGSTDDPPRPPRPEPRPSPVLPADAGEPVRAVGDVVAGTGAGLAQTVAPLSPEVAVVVDETGKVAGDTVAAATEAVAALLDALVNP